ncbi:hypothetical protein [Chitinimonas sp.]|uniref:hypothetical protein n=1 Tax=Chitinimonas sp. TaxID=1934313 RepID=UPI002F936F0D
MSQPLAIELASPQTVAGCRAAYQSLWLLVRLVQAQAQGVGMELVRLAELRQQFPDTRNLRMLISRAYKDFARWGVRVGWGDDPGRDPRFLNPDGRSQGPFWLPAGEAARIALLVEGRPAQLGEVADFLGQARADEVKRTAGGQGIAFWLALAGAQQDLRQGRLLAMLDTAGGSSQLGALAGFKAASELANDGLQQALSALGEASVWRRLDDLSSARQTLSALRRALKEADSDESGYLDAMEQILSAWVAWGQREAGQAEAILTGMRSAEPRASVVRHHPRIRFEWYNLSALIARARALAGNGPDQALRRQWAEAALAHFHRALEAAFEFGSFDAAQQVAANTGMAIWLFAGEGLTGERRTAGPEALRWLLFSEWLCRCAGSGGLSAWNAIYLMRIARGDCPRDPTPSLAVFRRYQPVEPGEVRAQAGSWGGVDCSSLLPASWLALAGELILAQREGRARFSLLQRCGLYLEHAWYALHAGETALARQSLAQLASEQQGLPPSDKAFFCEVVRTLPPL